MLEIKGLNKSFGKKQVLKDINLIFDKKVYGLLGPNGAGKTTLLRCLTSLYGVKKGIITLNGKDISDKTYLSFVGYLPQRFGLFRDLSASEALIMLAGLKNISGKTADDEARRVLDLVNLADKADVKIRKLSGGMVRRLGIAQAFLGDPEVLILDEPTAGLDPEERIRFGTVISENSGGKTVIISTHIVSDVEEACGEAVVINGGEILVCAPVADVARRAAGKVYNIPENEAGEFAAVRSGIVKDGASYRRVLSREPLPYELQAPTLEDGYMCWLKNI